MKSLQRSPHAATWIGSLVLLLAGASGTLAANYTVDGVHSSVVFRAKHLGTSYFWGRFNNPAGKLTLDDAGGSVEITIKADSIDTANSGRDDHLKSPDFFNARQFPEITFKSTSVKKLDAEKYDVEGTLTLHGVSKPLTVQVVRTGTGRGQRGGNIAGFETTFEIKRSDFGMSNMLQGISDEVKVIANLECAER